MLQEAEKTLENAMGDQTAYGSDLENEEVDLQKLLG